MSKKNQYVPPAAELILLAPCENLALWEIVNKNLWKNPGYHEPGEYASAFVFQTTISDETTWQDVPGFTIKQ